jgi:hypothetical protein
MIKKKIPMYSQRCVIRDEILQLQRQQGEAVILQQGTAKPYCYWCGG